MYQTKQIVVLLTFSLALVSCSSQLAMKDFRNLPEDVRIETVGKRIVEQFLTSDPLKYGPEGYRAPRKYGEGESVHYSVISLWVNSIELARLTDDSEMKKRLIEKFEPFFGEKKNLCNRSDHVDFSIFGALPLEIFLMNGDERAREMGLRYADHQWENPVGKPGEKVGGYNNFPIERQREMLAQGYSPQTRLWIDDMYMITALQTQAYRATGDFKYIERTAKEMKMYLDELQRDNGLFYHSPSAPFFWGRGNGWMAGGLPMLLSYLPKNNKYRPALMDAYRKMMATLLSYQHENGLWGQLIDDPEFWEETSSSAMFTYAFIEGVRHGWLDAKTYGPAAKKAWVALCGKLDQFANIDDVCVGTSSGNNREHYYNRPRANGDPHGQAPLLWVCNALLRR